MIIQKTIRENYLNLIKESFILIGYDSVKAANNASIILALETQLAKASMSRVDQHDPQNIYHKMTVKELASISPDFEWSNYFTIDRSFQTGRYKCCRTGFY